MDRFNMKLAKSHNYCYMLSSTSQGIISVAIPAMSDPPGRGGSSKKAEPIQKEES